ncbi:MAG: VWA domain-containing protein [Thaumarchaeota archaeon]|nr:VWA domain-containing protein [Nitrososphaerota archaeon]
MNLEKDNDFFAYVYDAFSKFAQKKPELTNLRFSRKIDYPLINRLPEVSIIMPLPRFKNELFFFEGFTFENTLEQRHVLWSLFLASLYHLAAHAAVSRYGIYEKWMKNKTRDICIRVIDFIEDLAVEKYTMSTYPEIWKSMLEMNKKFAELEKHAPKTGNYYKAIIPKSCNIKNQNMLNKITASINQMDAGGIHYGEKVLEIADLLYKNRQLLPKTRLPYCESDDNNADIVLPKKINLKFEFDDEFSEMAYKLDDLWEVNEQSRIRLVKQYGRHMKGLHFDSIVTSQEDLPEFIRVREKILPMLRRIRQQIRMIVNLTDSPKMDEVGIVDMQMAIQAIASKGRLTEVFEHNEDRRAEEAWVILIDKSASMRLRFDHIKEFAVCVAEAANELAGRPDAWAMYSFDNNFQILKDFREKYGQRVQARLGGLQNSGLSLLPDAIELSYKMLAADQREKKYLFVITDGHASGYERIQEHFSKIAKKVEISGITLVAIGVSKATSKRFRNSARGTDLKQLVAKFITAYRTASSDM